MKTNLLRILIPLAAGCLAGCQGSAATPSKTAAPAAAAVSEAGNKVRALDDLPAIGDYLPPLDEGRVEVAPPEGWKPLSRRSSYLAAFVAGNPSDLPRIVVTTGEPPAADLGDTTDENAGALAAALDAQLRQDATKVVPEPCLPIVLGERAFVRHVRLARLSGDPAVIQSLQTVAGGRLYTVELICNVNAADGREYMKSLKEHRDQGYAVAAHLKFGDPAPPVEPPPAEAAPVEAVPPEAAEKPADKPAEENAKP